MRVRDPKPDSTVGAENDLPRSSLLPLTFMWGLEPEPA